MSFNRTNVSTLDILVSQSSKCTQMLRGVKFREIINQQTAVSIRTNLAEGWCNRMSNINYFHFYVSDTPHAQIGNTDAFDYHL